jgi:acetylornithine deacetylase
MGVLPGEPNESARRALEDAIQLAAISDPWLRENPPRVDWFEGQFESGEIPLDHPLIQQLAIAHQHVTGFAPTMRGVTYGSDMRLFTNHAKIAATHYGPGDVGMAHAVNEFVPLDEVLTATKVAANLIAQWCGGEIA